MDVRSLLAARFGRLVVLGIAVVTLATTSVASADHHLEPGSDDTGLSRIETGPLIAGVLTELGLDADDIALLVGELRVGVSERVTAMVDEGLLTAEQFESLGGLLAAGTFGDHIPTLVDDTRARRSAFRAAALAALAHLGVTVPDGMPVEDVLHANNLTPSELAKVLEELGIDLPPPPHHGPAHQPPADQGPPLYPFAPVDADDVDLLPPSPYPTSGGEEDDWANTPPPPTALYPERLPPVGVNETKSPHTSDGQSPEL